MTLVSPSQSNPGDEIRAASINDPVNDLADVINGNIDDTNIASVSGSKIANATITNAKLSTAAGELGGEWQTWTPTVTGGSGMNTSAVSVDEARYTRIGKTIFFSIRAVFTTSGSPAQTINFTTPIAMKTTQQLSLGSTFVNDGILYAGAAFRTDTSTVSVRRYDSANWGLGSSRGISVSGFYEVA